MSSRARRQAHPAFWVVLGCGLTVAALIGVGALPATSKKSIGSRVETFRLPLGVKLASFWYRDWMYRHLVREILQGASSDVERVNRLYDWTVAHVRTNIPEDWVVEDDHPLHIIIRGYGVDWQVADVFTILCTYAGYPAMMGKAQLGTSRERVVLALVSLRGQWRVFDPYYHNRLIMEDGLPVSLSRLQQQPELIRQAPHQPVIAGIPYADYFHDIRPLEAGAYIRAYRQMWWPRLWHELGSKVFG